MERSLIFDLVGGGGGGGGGKAPEKFFPYIFLCVGQLVSGSVHLELSPLPPPPPVGVGQVLWVPAKSGCLPFSFCPPFDDQRLCCGLMKYFYFQGPQDQENQWTEPGWVTLVAKVDLW